MWTKNLPSRRKKREVTPLLVKFDVVEIAQDRAVGGHVHGLVVIAVQPGVELGFVAGFAFQLGPRRWRGALVRHRQAGPSLQQHINRDQQNDDRQSRQADQTAICRGIAFMAW